MKRRTFKKKMNRAHREHKKRERKFWQQVGTWPALRKTRKDAEAAVLKNCKRYTVKLEWVEAPQLKQWDK